MGEFRLGSGGALLLYAGILNLAQKQPVAGTRGSGVALLDGSRPQGSGQLAEFVQDGTAVQVSTGVRLDE